MYQLIRLWHRALLTVLLLGVAAGARASHYTGGEITYQHLGNNQYRVRAAVYVDCAAVLGPTLALVYRNTGCTGGTMAVAALTGSAMLGADYCASAPAGASPCGFGQPVNYARYTYEATVSLPPGRWTLSFALNARANLANVANATSVDLYQEAMLDNSSGLANNSAVFANQNSQFMGYQLPTNFSQLALDADGDSLVYSLVAPLQSCNSPVSYRNRPGGLVNVAPANATSICYASTSSAATYSPVFPIPSYSIWGNCPLVRGTPYFDFNEATGEFSFIPRKYEVGGAIRPDSAYAIAMQVDEYRRMPGGSYVFVGSVRRDLTFRTIEPWPNQNPELAPLRVNGSATPQPIEAAIPVAAGQPVSVQLTSTDANAGQLLTLSSNAAQLLPGAVFAASGPAAQPTATLTWTPPATLRPGLYYCTVATTDDNCPIKGYQARTLTFRVGGSALATKAAQQATQLVAVPTPFNSEVRFQLAKAGVQTVQVYDQLGRQVAELQSQPSGQVRWQPATGVAPGLYLARTPDGRQVARLLRAE